MTADFDSPPALSVRPHLTAARVVSERLITCSCTQSWEKGGGGVRGKITSANSEPVIWPWTLEFNIETW